jgi:hypothetical protein
MRRILIAVVAVVSVAVVPGMASASHSTGNGPNYDKTNGTGESFELGTVQTVHVDAKSVGGTTAAQGHFRVTNSPFSGNADVSGDLVCHHAGPGYGTNGSSTVGVIRRSSNPVLVGAAVAIWIDDEGEPGTGRDDLFVGGLASPPPPSFCNLPFNVENNLMRGDFIVHDGA